MVPAIVALGLGLGYLSSAAALSVRGQRSPQAATDAQVQDGRHLDSVVMTVAHKFAAPVSLAVDREGTVFVSDARQCDVRLVDRDGVMVLIAGGAPGYADGWYDKARFASPDGVAIGPGGDVWVADRGSHCLRRISRKAGVSTAAGVFEVDRDLFPAGGFADGAAIASRFNGPRGLAVAHDGAVLIADSGNSRVRRLTPHGTVETIAGPYPDAAGEWGTLGLTVPGGLSDPVGLATGPDGTVFISEPTAGKVWRLQNGSLSLLAAGLATPTGLAVSADGAVFIAETGRNRVVRVGSGGMAIVAGDAAPGSADGSGLAARFNSPEGLAIDGQGTLFVADTGNQRVRVIRSAI
jgi:sugar lactone lactonase YvrE